MTDVAIRFGVNLLILAVVVAAWLVLWSVPQVLHEPERTGELLYGAILYWGAMLLPTLTYLVALELLGRRVTGWRLRLAAILLSPICAVALYVAAMAGAQSDVGITLLQALSLPVPYGLIVRLS